MITEVVASAFFKSKIIPERAFGEGGGSSGRFPGDRGAGARAGWMRVSWL